MKQLEIGICDDEVLAVRQLSRLVQRVVEEENLICKIYSFTSGEQLLQEVRKMDMVFLDIEMPNLDGIVVGNKIRKMHENCKIIMATGRTERFKEAFKFQAFRFITKPFEVEEIKEVLDAYQDLEIGMETIKLYKDRNPYNIVQKQIQYIISYDSYTEYFVDGKKFRQTYSLNQLETILDSRCFYRVHRQYLVNLYWIQNYKNEIIYIGTEQIPVSRRKRKEFEKFYLEFDLKYQSI